MTSLTSELILRLKDDVSPGAKAVAAALKGIEAAEKGVGAQSSAMQKLTQSLDAAKNGLNKLATARAAQQRLVELAAAEEKARVRLRDLGNQIMASTKSTTVMERAYAQAEKMVRKTTDAVGSQKYALSQVMAEMSSMGISVGNLAASEARLSSSIAKTTSAIRAQAEAEARAVQRRTAAIQQMKEVGRAAGGYGAMVVGGGLVHMTEKSLHAGATLSQTKAMLKQAGATPDEVKKAQTDYRAFSREHPGITESEYLLAFKDARMIAPHEQFEMTHLSAKMRAALRNSGLSVDEKDMGDALRIVDELGLKTSEERESFIDNVVKTQQSFGNQVPIGTLLSAVRNAKQSVYKMSPKFINDYLPTILQSAGQNGGTEIMTAYNNYIGQHMTHAELKQLAAAGFADPKDFVYNKVGDIKSMKPGAKFWKEDLFKENIAEWSWDFHKKFMSKPGATEEKFDKLVATMPRNMAALIDFLVHNEERIKRDAENREKASGLQAADSKSLAENPIAGLAALRDAIESFGEAVTNPTMKTVGSILAEAASGMQSLAASYKEWADAHPDLAKVVGGGATVGGLGVGGGLLVGGGKAIWDGLTSGFGLKGSALALDASAAALTNAAAALGGGAALDGLPNRRDGAKKAGFLKGLWSKGKAMLPFLASPYTAGIAVGGGVIYAMDRAGIGKVDKEIDASRAVLRKQNRDWSPRLQEKMYGGDEDVGYLTPGGEKYLGKVEDHGFHGMVPGAASAGQEAGSQAGQSIAEGVQSKSGEVEAAAQALMDRLRAVFSRGVDVPIRLNSSGAAEMRGVHADAGIDALGP